MLKSSERKQPVPVLAVAGERLLTSSQLRQEEIRGMIPAVTATLTKCKERTEKSWQWQRNPFTLLPKFWKDTSFASSLKSPPETHANIGFFPADPCSGGDSLPPPAPSFCRALVFWA